MGSHSRNKGAAFERAIAKELLLLTGVTFARNLNQYQAAGKDDLTPDDTDWPFSIECKASATGTTCKDAWKAQAINAAGAKIPCVIYKFDRRPVRVAVPMMAVAIAFGGPLNCDEWIETTLEGLAYLAREIMAEPV